MPKFISAPIERFLNWMWIFQNFRNSLGYFDLGDAPNIEGKEKQAQSQNNITKFECGFTYDLVKEFLNSTQLYRLHWLRWSISVHSMIWNLFWISFFFLRTFRRTGEVFLINVIIERLKANRHQINQRHYQSCEYSKRLNRHKSTGHTR